MLRHYINYLDNIYYVEQNDSIVFSAELKKDNTIKVRTPTGEFEWTIEDKKRDK